MNPSRKQGFALVVVLFSLAILTLLFSAASTRTLASLQFGTAEVVASERAAVRIEALDALVALGRPEGDRLDWGGQMFRLQSTGGLVDLNTAAPELLERLLAGYGFSTTEQADALQSYRMWRRTGYRLQRVSDFVRVAGLTSEDLPDLAALATVHSGRSTISAEQAPLSLLQHLTGAQGDVDTLTGLLPPALLGVATSTNFAVFEGQIRIGVVGFGPAADQHKVLAIN